MSLLDNSFIRIPNNRSVGIEKEFPRENEVGFSPTFLKNWLLQQKLSRENDKLFHSINSKFSSDPFLHGKISVARIGDDEIEIFITDGSGLKLPIGRKGTGVQQILMILSYIAQYDSPFVGIEELETNLSPKSQTSILRNFFDLVYQKNDSLINQIFLTTHSPYMATGVSNKIDRRLVSMSKDGETQVSDPTEENDFFDPPKLL
jgi:hypothetical protein